MLTLGLRRPITAALIDVGDLDDLPDPETLAEAIANAVGKNATFSRVACLVRTQAQEQFAGMLQRMAARPDDVAVFFAEGDALKWLGIEERCD